MMQKTVVCPKEADTLALGDRLGTLLFPGAFVALTGDLGAGKTALTRGIGHALGTDDIASPTFTIVREHETTPRLFHFDAYRLENAEELYAIGFSDYLEAGAVIVMEWAELVSDALPAERLDVRLTGSGGEPRTAEFCAHGARYEELLEKL